MKEGLSEVASEQRPKGAEKCTLCMCGGNFQAERAVCAKGLGQDPGCWKNSQGAYVAGVERMRGREGGGRGREGPEQVLQGLGASEEAWASIPQRLEP